jgi:hypothetical protein
MVMSSPLFWSITQFQWQSFTDVSGQRIGPILKGQEVQVDFLPLEDGTDTLS